LFLVIDLFDVVNVQTLFDCANNYTINFTMIFNNELLNV